MLFLVLSVSFNEALTPLAISLIHNFYRPQSSCRKVMFSQAGVKNSVHGRCIPACTGADSSRADIPPADTSPWSDTPLRHPPLVRHSDTPLGRHPPHRRPLQRTVRILLECILVVSMNLSYIEKA